MELRPRRLPKRSPAEASTKGCKFPASSAPQESSPSFPECPLSAKRFQCKIQSLQFNPDLILLKPPRNAKALTYSHWGWNKPRRIEGSAPETGFGFFNSSESQLLPKPLAFHTCSRLTAQSSLAFRPRKSSAKSDLHERLVPVVNP